MTVEEAAGPAIATSGAAVLFAGATVVIAICGLAIAGIPAVTVMGLMAGLTVAVMVAISADAAARPARASPGTASTPSACRACGRRRAGRPRRGSRCGTAGGRQVSAHPWRYLVAGRLVLGLLAAPLLAMRLGMTDNGAGPDGPDHPAGLRPAGRRLRPGFNGPLLLSVELDGATVDDLAPAEEAVAADPGVQAVAPARAQRRRHGRRAAGHPHHVAPGRGARPTSSTACATTSSPRPRPAPGAEVYVGGQTAMFIDMSDQVADRLPWFVGAVILLSVILLMMVFRSVAVPLKAAAMNLLSIGAAYGVIVAVFQWGWRKGLFGVEETVPIVSFMPMMLFAILFGLSMDYEVFLLSRVREEYLRHGDNDAAVVEGILGHRPGHHLGGAHHDQRVRRLRAGRRPGHQDVRPGPGHRGVHRRHDRPHRARAGDHAPARRLELVAAGWLDRLLPNLDVEGGCARPGRGPGPRPPGSTSGRRARRGWRR